MLKMCENISKQDCKSLLSSILLKVEIYCYKKWENQYYSYICPKLYFKTKKTDHEQN